MKICSCNESINLTILNLIKLSSVKNLTYSLKIITFKSKKVFQNFH